MSVTANSRIFVNLPVADLPRSRAFFETLGLAFNPHFSDETAACLVINETIFSMLLTHAKYKEFCTKPIADAHRTSEVLIALSLDSKAEVDRLMALAIAAGASESWPARDLGFMKSRAFDDPDGHIWELFWMDPQAIPG